MVGGSRKSEISLSTSAPRRSERIRKLAQEVQTPDQSPSSSTSTLKKLPRKRNAQQKEEASIFETPPPSIKKQKRKQATSIKQLETKNLFPSPTLLTLPVEVQNRFLSYLDVTSIESLGRTCSHFDLLINGRFLTSLSLPLDHTFLQELTETNTLEKKPLLRLESNKPRESGNKEDDTWYGHFMAKFIDSKRSLKDYIIHSQMSLLSLSKVREIDLVAKGFRGEDLKNSTSMLECFQTLDRIILRQMSSLGHLANITRLDIMIVEDDFCQTLLKEFIPSLTNLLVLGITIGERKNRLISLSLVLI